MPSQAMGARDERTQEAACVNHKRSLLGVKYKERSIAGLTSPYRLQISMYKEKISGTELGQLFPQSSPWLSHCPWCQQSWHWKFPKLSSLHLSACELWHHCKACVPAQSGRFQSKGLQMDFTFPEDSWDFVPSEDGIFKIGTKEVGKAT